jgi:hypothetical protein
LESLFSAPALGRDGARRVRTPNWGFYENSGAYDKKEKRYRERREIE